MIRIFDETEVDQIFRENDNGIEEKIRNENDDIILNENEEKYIESVVKEFSIIPLEIKFKEKFISNNDVDVPEDRFPFGLNTYTMESYKKNQVTYHLPYEGTESLIRAKPNPFIAWSTEITTEDHCICFPIIDFYNDLEKVNVEAETTIRDIQTQLEHQTEQINGYNSKLHSKIQGLFLERKNNLKKRAEDIAKLGLKVKDSTENNETFTIELPKKRGKIKPVIKTHSALDPTLDDSTYQEILERIHEWGKGIEKLPLGFVDRTEEELRDDLLVTLNPVFIGSVAGEAFNKKGKTDVLMTHNGNNVFVAECKIWYGQKEFLGAIDQLLHYLTWRDSKTAVIVFVKNKKILDILKTVEEVTPKHNNYLNFIDKKDESWFNYKFHFSFEKEREIKVSILLFHLPNEK